MAKAKQITQLDIHAHYANNAHIIIMTRLDEMYSWDGSVDDPDRVQDLHNLRIAAKRLRYTLEMFEAMLPEEHVLLRKEVEQIQEELGALHDSDVMISLLQLCLSHQDSIACNEDVQSTISHELSKVSITLDPALLACLLNPAVAPSAQERQGLILLLTCLQQEREKQYTIFLDHWSRLKEQDLRGQVVELLEK